MYLFKQTQYILLGLAKDAKESEAIKAGEAPNRSERLVMDKFGLDEDEIVIDYFNCAYK